MVTDERKKSAIWLGRGRIAIGLGALVSPRAASGVWVGGESSSAARAITRSFGAREFLLGAGTIIATESGSGGASWLSICAVADGLDAVIGLLQPGLHKRTRFLALLAAASAVTQFRMSKQLAVLENPDARV